MTETEGDVAEGGDAPEVIHENGAENTTTDDLANKAAEADDEAEDDEPTTENQNHNDSEAADDSDNQDKSDQKDVVVAQSPSPALDIEGVVIGEADNGGVQSEGGQLLPDETDEVYTFPLIFSLRFCVSI